MCSMPARDPEREIQSALTYCRSHSCSLRHICTHLTHVARETLLAVATHRAEGFKLFVGDEPSVQAEQEDGGVGEHPPQDDEVVHVRTGHLD